MRVRLSDEENMDIMDMSGFLDDPDIFNDLSLENEMAGLKKASDKPAVDKPAKAPKVAKPVTDKPKGVFGPRAVPEGHIGLDALATEFGLKPAVARRKLRLLEGVSKPEGQHGWYWKENSRELASIRKAFAVKE